MEYLNNQEFYELMQQYRNAPIDNQAQVIRAFEAVKTYIRAETTNAVIKCFNPKK